MKIGKKIQELRLAQNISIEKISSELNLKPNEYLDIENDAADITLSQLDSICKILMCSPIDVLQLEDEPSGHIRNYFFNHAGNSGININVQGINQEEVRKAYKEIYIDELKRIPQLEKLLRDNNIEFNV